MVNQAISVTVKPFFGMAKRMELCMEEEPLHVTPPYKPHPEPFASVACFDGDATTRRFMQNIRQYNCLFAFTSMGARVDNSINDGRGPPIFKISG
jgi:hypothetical protein